MAFNMKHPSHHILLFAVLFFFHTAKAQTNYEDVLYLKNGSIIHGIIIEQVPNESLKIQTKDRNVFVYRMDEVLKISKEEIDTPKNRREPMTKNNIKKKGYLNITEISLGRNVLDNGSREAISGNQNAEGMPSVGVQTVNGYLFNPWFSAGFGIGLHSYDNLGFVPLFFDARYYFLDDLATPFLAVDAGYSFTIQEVYGLDDNIKYFGGTYLNPAAGIKFNTRKSKALAFSIGYRLQQTRVFMTDGVYNRYSGNYNNGVWKNYDLGFLNMKVGFVF
jgi:hypothetical protein